MTTTETNNKTLQLPLFIRNSSIQLLTVPGPLQTTLNPPALSSYISHSDIQKKGKYREKKKKEKKKKKKKKKKKRNQENVDIHMLTYQ